MPSVLLACWVFKVWGKALVSANCHHINNQKRPFTGILSTNQKRSLSTHQKLYNLKDSDKLLSMVARWISLHSFLVSSRPDQIRTLKSHFHSSPKHISCNGVRFTHNTITALLLNCIEAVAVGAKIIKNNQIIENDYLTENNVTLPSHLLLEGIREND